MLRVGQGYDIHRLVEGRPLLLGGVRIDHPQGLLGHSDADVVLHALIDAILGAAGLGDIGQHFPDNDESYRGADSATLLAHVVELLAAEAWTIVNVDLTIHAERPKLAPYREPIRQRIADLLGIETEQVNLKAKTNEGLDAVGKGEAIAATVVVLISRDGGR